MTHDEAVSWGCPTSYPASTEKCTGRYNGVSDSWWLADAYNTSLAWYMGAVYMSYDGFFTVTFSRGVRPAVSIPNGATITGSGTQGSPYVITINN